MMWFKRKAPIVHVAKALVLRYKDIPEKTDKRLVTSAYPQSHSAMPASSLQTICSRYADQLHELIDALPLSAQQIDEIVMPVLQRVIELVHLLPASEVHHHSGVGGCLLHQLECATETIKLIKDKTFRGGETLEENYHNKNRILLAAVLVALTHDVGKIFDVRVVDANDHEWEPEKESLMQWLVRLKLEEYFVTWHVDRQHKSHQVRSLRLAYGRVFTPQLIHFLDAYPHSRLLCKFDDAVALGTGPFADVLRQAEEISIKHDAEVRRHLLGQYAQASSPLIQPMLTAMLENLSQGIWSVNKSASQVFVTNQGTFLLLSEQVVFSVRRKAAEQGVSYLPGTVAGFVRVLAEGDCLQINPRQEEGRQYIWSIYLKFADVAKRYECLKLVDGQKLFKSGLVPETINIVDEAEVPQVTGKAPEVDFRAPTGDFIRKNKATREPSDLVTEHGNSSGQELSQTELNEVWRQKPEAEVCQRFIERLCRTLHQQILRGKGSLIAQIQTVSPGQWRVDSTGFEAVLRRHCIETKTVEMLFRMRTKPPFFTFVPDKHFIICREQVET